MTLPNEADRLGRMIHEIIHEIADDKDVLGHCVNRNGKDNRNGRRNLVAVIINKWEKYKEEYISNERL